METELILEKITRFADQAHGEQMRKYTPERYIVHPVRVMEICRNYLNELPVLAAALLHDVLEDTDTSAEEILRFLSELMPENEAKRTLKLVLELTDIYTHSDFPQWNRDKRKSMETQRLSKVSADAQTIKYADITDNSLEIMNYDPDFGLRFLKEVKATLKAADRGNPELRKRAFEVVNAGLK